MKLAIAALTLFTAAASAQQQQQPLTKDGPALYRYYCASCHGMEAKGDGPLAKALKTPPPDLTKISARNHGKFPLERVNKIIAGDEGATKAHGSKDMPVWGPFFSQVENDQDAGPVRIDNLARYLRKIQKP